MSTRRGHACDVLVGILVAVLRNVLAVESVEVSEECEYGCQPVPWQAPTCAASVAQVRHAGSGVTICLALASTCSGVICFRH